MKTTRRKFLTLAGSASALSMLPALPASGEHAQATDEAWEKVAAKPVLDLKGLKGPILIETIQLLKKGRLYFVRARSKDGAEGISVDNGRADVLHPILNQLVIPYFIGKDALELEEHLFGVYRTRTTTNFKDWHSGAQLPGWNLLSSTCSVASPANRSANFLAG